MTTFAQDQRNIIAYLPSLAECLAILIGTAELTIFGIGGLANPSAFATGFGLPLLKASQPQPGIEALSSISKEKNSAGPVAKTSAEELEHTQGALVSAMAARNIHNGILLLMFGMYRRDRTALGLVVGTGLVTTLTDYLVVRWYGVKEAAFGHLIGVVNCVLVGGSLLYWKAGDDWIKR